VDAGVNPLPETSITVSSDPIGIELGVKLVIVGVG
jgi:hypothetical protein